MEPQITLGSIARRVGRNGTGSSRVRTPHFGGFTICIKNVFLFRRSRRLPAPFRPSGPSFEPHFSVRCIARRVGRNGAGSGRKRHPLPNSTRITEEIVFSTRCSASLLCAAKWPSPLCRTTLPRLAAARSPYCTAGGSAAVRVRTLLQTLLYTVYCWGGPVMWIKLINDE